MAAEEYDEALGFLCNLDTLVVKSENDIKQLWADRRLPLKLTGDFHANWSHFKDEEGVFVDRSGAHFRVEAKSDSDSESQCNVTYQKGPKDPPDHTMYPAIVVAKTTWKAFQKKWTPEEKELPTQATEHAFIDRFLSKLPRAWRELILARNLHLNAAKQSTGPSANSLDIYKNLACVSNIRVITIHPALESSSPIRCSLREERLDSPPEFQALSYVWGNPSPRREIVLNGVEFSVTENLYFALESLRQRSSDRTMWIDAICINQSNLDERQSQVAQMDDIYKQATGVVVWLGHETETSSKLFKGLNHMLQLLGPLARSMASAPVWDGLEYPMARGIHFAESPALPMGESCPECMSAPFSAFRMNLPSDQRQGLEESTKAHNSLQHKVRLSGLDYYTRMWQLAGEEQYLKLLQRPYWGRMWVLQEVILARKLTVQCGRQSADWHLLQGAIAATLRLAKKTCWGGDFALGRAFILMNQLQQRVSDIFPFMFLQNNTQFVETLGSEPLATYLSITARSQATDPRDKIYGLLGLLPQGSAAREEFKPNYSQSAKRLFIEVAKYFLNTTSGLHVLTARPWKKKNAPAGMILDLPSWAPDWTAEPDTACNVISLGVFSNFHTRSLFRGIRSQAQSQGGTSSDTTVFNAGLGVDPEHPYSFSCFDGVFSVYGLEVDEITSVFRDMRKPTEARTLQDFETWQIESIAKNPDPMKQMVMSSLIRSCDTRWNACHGIWGDQYGLTGQPMQEAFWRTLLLDRFYDTFGSPSKLARIPRLEGPTDASRLFNHPGSPSHVERGLSDCQFPPQTPRDKEKIMNYLSSQLYDGLAAFNTDFHGRLLPFFITKNGYIGLGHPDAAVGDTVAVLRGGSVPYILRGYGEGHTLVGECYVHGIMDGEFFDRQTQDGGDGKSKGELTRFRLI